MTNLKLTIEVDGQTHVMEGTAAIFATKTDESEAVSSGLTGIMSEGDQMELMAGLTSAITRQAESTMKGIIISLGGVMTAVKKIADETEDPGEAEAMEGLLSSVGMVLVKAAVNREINKRAARRQGDVQ